VRAEWLSGWDPTPGIVSVWAEPDGRASVWRRVDGRLVRDDVRFRPWLVLAHASDAAGLTVRELAGEGELRFLARADDATFFGLAIAVAIEDGQAVQPEAWIREQIAGAQARKAGHPATRYMPS